MMAMSLFGASSFYSLDNVDSLSYYYAGKNNFISKEHAKTMKADVTNRLIKAGFSFGQTDALILVVKINAIVVDKTQVVNVEISLAEDVVTNRKEKIEAFSLTYIDSKMFKTQTPYKDSMKTLDTLIDKFIALHKDDNEE